MKHYFIFTVIALAISFATGCKKDDSTPRKTQKKDIPHKENIRLLQNRCERCKCL